MRTHQHSCDHLTFSLESRTTGNACLANSLLRSLYESEDHKSCNTPSNSISLWWDRLLPRSEQRGTQHRPNSRYSAAGSVNSVTTAFPAIGANILCARTQTQQSRIQLGRAQATLKRAVAVRSLLDCFDARLSTGAHLLMHNACSMEG